ncbi:type II toxin-antitoxin system PemK/MazF family toxin [Tautonia rosea]|uniref:type II toxin-antitoxin system PemK/MazF family toxin n=1 Tax=Tautonia rosea TaxID=2728037 RepID=UPI001473ED07|nr:type II toxin-antitoxin system PemK/MazF family toxin [Tautonia rosea]
MKRGDIVLAVAPGDYGKPRPAVIVQSDLFNPTHASLLVCLLTSESIEAPLFRLTLSPSRENGLLSPSQIMVDKLLALPRGRIRERIGTLDDETLLRLNRSLALMLGLAGK